MTDAHAAPRGVGVVVVAAGSGSRLGAGRPKAFVPLGGRPLLDWALEGVAAVAGLRSVAVVVPAELVDADGWAGVALPPGATVVAGGAERTESVAAGLAVLDPACDVVLVHDAARCLTPVSVFDRVVEAVRAGADGVVPGLAVVDTVKTVDTEGYVTGTPDRSGLRAVQTPQGFPRDVLLGAHASGMVATDDAALVERTGHRVRVVEGDPLAFKVTTPDDLARAERLVARA
ncbi:2-C-methyl-D-erythritol 4-phosphate cytidylyltransferase [Phycicoccus sp. CSK15P-2]|uniref:2-C-methyl-D-erythritol 4-phosphate cytidylyltransferase n=1 Tax=Phycicoccus sp. CSK15P-2 TaxID=2807627 RepID=UPI00194EFBFE|nr:2-C-methyl-D-erythritol 4-phosphate cytidylyltransferase [Phycicoccus sp. CSK15P-2]MBM6403146.1 2-C-methyl-D-erythritol 4-phosphate cytidylyltransferase [Phycicoccus sp. CSK15P-2]